MVQVVQTTNSHQVKYLNNFSVTDIEHFILSDIMNDLLKDQLDLLNLNILLAVPILMIRQLNCR